MRPHANTYITKNWQRKKAKPAVILVPSKRYDWPLTSTPFSKTNSTLHSFSFLYYLSVWNTTFAFYKIWVFFNRISSVICFSVRLYSAWDFETINFLNRTYTPTIQTGFSWLAEKCKILTIFKTILQKNIVQIADVFLSLKKAKIII